MSSTVRLGDIVRVLHGGTPSKAESRFWAGDIPWVSPKDFNKGELRPPQDFITIEAVNNSAASVVPRDTVLAVARSGVLAHSFPVALASQPMSFNQDIKALLPDIDRIAPRYLYHLLQSLAMTVVQRGVKRGATVHSLQSGFLEAVEFQLPSLREQRRIVDILDRASSIQKLRKQAEAKVQEIIPALFVDMFGDPATNPRGWQIKLLADVTEIGSGVTKGRRLDGERISVPYLRVANVQDGYLSLDEIKEIKIRPTEKEKFALRRGDLVMTEGGDLDKLGRGFVWEEQLPYCAHQNHIFRVRPNRDLLDPYFLAQLIQSWHGKSYFLQVAKRTTGIASINKTQLGRLPVWLPNLSLQKSFARQAESASAISRRLRGAAINFAHLQASLLSQYLHS